MDEYIKNEEFESEINKEETIKCRYCGRELNENFEFCVYCGKNQSDVPMPVKPREEKKKPLSVKPKKKKASNIVLFILSLVLFGAGAVFFVLGIINWLGLGMISSGSVFGNLFGSVDVSSYIIAFINIVASFFCSVIFMLAGIAVNMYRKN